MQAIAWGHCMGIAWGPFLWGHCMGPLYVAVDVIPSLVLMNLPANLHAAHAPLLDFPFIKLLSPLSLKIDCSNHNHSILSIVPPYMDTTNLEVDVRVIKGKIVVFNCPVQGIPFPNITWFKGNDTLALDPRMRILMAGRQLELSMTEESDATKYTCQATNIAGHARMGFNLSVHGT